MVGLAVEILILIAVCFEAWVSWKAYRLMKAEADRQRVSRILRKAGRIRR